MAAALRGNQDAGIEDLSSQAGGFHGSCRSRTASTCSATSGLRSLRPVSGPLNDWIGCSPNRTTVPFERYRLCESNSLRRSSHGWPNPRPLQDPAENRRGWNGPQTSIVRSNRNASSKRSSFLRIAFACAQPLRFAAARRSASALERLELAVIRKPDEGFERYNADKLRMNEMI